LVSLSAKQPYENNLAAYIGIYFAKCLHGISPGCDGATRTPFTSTKQRGYPSCGSSGSPTKAN
jgi:hypothetical protein